MAASESAARLALAPADEGTPEYREWLAAAYDTDVYEQWLKPFEEMILRRLEPLPRGMALEIGCATGRGTERLVQAIGSKARLVAQDDRGFLLDLARARLADQVGSRLFFNSDHLPRLRYDEKVFSAVVCNLGWWESGDRAALLSELVRVLDDDGAILLTAPLAGTFAELIDLVREVTTKLDLTAKLEPQIAALEAMFATPEDWVTEIEATGLVDARVDCTEVELTFGSSRELFSSTVAQARWMGVWRRAFGEEGERLVWHVRQMLDAYWADGKFPVTIAAGCLTARRPEGLVVRKPGAPPPLGEDAVPVVLAGESDVDRAPAVPQAPAPPAAPAYASGDAIAAELLGLGPEQLAQEPPLPPTIAGAPAAQPLEVESVEAEPLDALDEVEPYVPDDDDLHGPVEGAGSSGIPDFEGTMMEDGAAVEVLDEDPGPVARGPSIPPVAPVPLTAPRAAPVHPVDLGRPQIEPVRPMELDAPSVEPDEVLPDWPDEDGS